MILHPHNIAVKQTNKVLSTDVENVVARGVVLVDLHTAGAEKVGDVVLTEESLGDLEASTAAECPMDVTHPDDRISDHVMVPSQHLRRDLR